MVLRLESQQFVYILNLVAFINGIDTASVLAGAKEAVSVDLDKLFSFLSYPGFQ